MIVITEHTGMITVKGHAGYDETGKDIVCAAISALFQTLGESLLELTGDSVECRAEPGDGCIKYKDLSEEGALLIRSFLVGAGEIADAYPRHVSVRRGRDPLERSRNGQEDI